MNRFFSLAVLSLIPLAAPQVSQAAPFPVGVQVQVGPASFNVQTAPCPPQMFGAPVVTAPVVTAYPPVVVRPPVSMVRAGYHWDGYRWITQREWLLRHDHHRIHHDHFRR
jgi:hypothetical protein